MDLNIGEYIRTHEGVISRIKYLDYDDIDANTKVLDEVTCDTYIYESGFGDTYYTLYDEDIEHRIKTHSNNILDLIEVGDYVNGLPIMDTNKYDNSRVINILGQIIKEEDVEKILTKDAIAIYEYRVKDVK